MITVHTTGVDLSGLLQVLGQHLYSTPDVAVRELVQNAHDSILRRQLEDAGPRPPPRIDVRSGELSLVVEDNGSGLTDAEIVRYLATIGVGYTRELRELTGSSTLIGLFGLGFLTAFVIAGEVTLETTSFQDPACGWRYHSRDGQRYTLERTPPRPVGTRVTLRVKPEHAELLGRLEGALDRYAALLSLPVSLEGEPINAEPPPWRKAEPDREDWLAFAARFERRFEPLCAVPVEAGQLRGVLWVHDQSTYGTSDNRRLSVFVRGMLLDDDHHDLLPPWAGYVSGVIETHALTPTASREDLQRDAAWDAAKATLEEALIAGLEQISREEPETWRRIRARHNEAMLGSALCSDRLFSLLGDALTVPTSEGDLLARAVFARGKRRAYVSMAGQGGFEETLFRALKVPVVAGRRYGALAFVRRYAEQHGGVVVQLGTEAGDRQVFHRVELPADEAQYLQQILALPGQQIIPARFQPPELPVVIVPDREAELKRRVESDEADKRIEGAALRLVRLWAEKVDDRVTARLYVNLESPAVQRLLAARGQDVDRGARLIRGLAVLLSGSGAGSEGIDLRPTLEDFTAAILAVLPEVRS